MNNPPQNHLSLLKRSKEYDYEKNSTSPCCSSNMLI